MTLHFKKSRRLDQITQRRSAPVPARLAPEHGRPWRAYALGALAWVVGAALLLSPMTVGHTVEMSLRAAVLLILGGVAVLMTRLSVSSERGASARYVRRLERLAGIDDLTGLANRRAFTQRLDYEIARAHRYGRPLSLVLFDLDRFKQVNDTHGHPAGDSALRAFASVLADTGRASDLPARLGGDEFALLLPETGEEAATAAITRLRAVLNAGPLLHLPNGTPLHMGVSAGVAEAYDGSTDASTLLEAADRALYAEKQPSGRR